MSTYEHWNLDNLKNHRFNAEVFGELGTDADCKEFVESVKESGVIAPVIIAGDGTIVSGHRRRQAAARAGLKEIDVIVRRDWNTPEAIDTAWFNANRQREMTTEQKARWFKKRQEIESAAAKKRQSAAGGSAPGKNALSAGRAADVAAAEVGMGRKTATDAAKVVEVIDDAEAKGDRETAAKLRETLNNGSVAAAKREADKVKPPKPRKKTAKRPQKNPELKKLDQTVGGVSRALAKAGSALGEGVHYRSIFDSLKSIKEAIVEWASA